MAAEGGQVSETLGPGQEGPSEPSDMPTQTLASPSQTLLPKWPQACFPSPLPQTP